jgi:hypothetical protein
MRFHARVSLLALLVGTLVFVSAPAVAQAAFGISKFEALSCSENEPEGEPEECSASTPSEFFTQAGGHPNFGITDFTFNNNGLEGNGVKSIRTDVPVGFSTNPQALPMCTLAEFEANLDLPEASHCPAASEAGTQEASVILCCGKFPTLEGKVYNLVPAKGLPLEFGIDLTLPAGVPYFEIHVHSLIEGGVSWHKEAEAEEEGIASGDYHEFFKIKVGKSLLGGEAPLRRSRLIFNGTVGNGLLTNPTTCPGPQTTTLRVEPYEGKAVHTSYTTTVTSAEEKCNLVQFEPKFVLHPSTTQADQPDGITTELKFPLNTSSSEIENSDLKTSKVTLPEGMTINPAGAAGMEGCTPEQIGIGSANEVACPSRSVLGSELLEVPGLPPGSLTGKVYLGKPATGPITGPPYTIYTDVESERYGQAVRLEGKVEPNLSTGQMTTTFANNPQGPFGNEKLTFNQGAFANLANPLTCGTAEPTLALTPYSSPLTAATPGNAAPFAIDSNGLGGTCPSTPTFSPTQSNSSEPAQGGASSTFTLNYERTDGQQYFSKLRTVLPAGLLGIITGVPLCTEAQASSNSCPSASRIGTTTVMAGAGTEPYPFKGSVYLTESFEGAPYGLSIVVPAVAGPFSLGNVRARAKIEIDPHTARVILTDNHVPSIVGGIPDRIKSISVTINRQGFERNPTNCGVLATESTLTGSLGTATNVSTPFQAEGCSALAFKPSFAAKTSGKPSKTYGASLETTINQGPGQANIKSVLVQLPKQLPSRLTTLQKACPEATFAANPYTCPAGSLVGGARANTPVLPVKMTGPAYLVSHGGAAFPDLDLVLEGNGVRVIVVGNTDIKKGITRTNFATTPDVPVSSITVNLPLGAHSALAAYGDLCVVPLVMPTTITGQNGKQVKQNTKISPIGCGVRIVGHKVIGNTAYLTIKTFGAGRISASGANVSRVSRTLSGATKAATLKVPLSSVGQSRGRPLRVRLRVGFVPKKTGPHSTAYVTVTFR